MKTIKNQSIKAMHLCLLVLAIMVGNLASAQSCTYQVPNNIPYPEVAQAKSGDVFCLNTDGESTSHPGYNYGGSIHAFAGSTIKVCGNVTLNGAFRMDAGSTLIYTAGSSLLVYGAEVNSADIQYSNEGCNDCPDVTLNQGNPIICVSEEIDLTPYLTSSTSEGSWSVNSNTASIVNNTFSSSSSGSYSVVFTANEQSSNCINSNAIIVTANPLPNVEAGDDQTVCFGAEVTLAGSDAASYTWNNIVINNQAFTPEATATYTVVGTDANGCENSDNVTVTVNPLPIVGAGEDQSICVGSEYVLSGTGAISYTWNNNVIDGQSFTPLSSTTYTVVGTDANGCEASDDVIININDLPAINAGNDITICQGEEVALSATGGVSYLWQQVVSQNSATGNATQDWNVIKSGTFYLIQNVTTGEYLKPVNGEISNHNFVISEEFVSGDNSFYWDIVPSYHTGYFNIISAENSSLSLRIANSSQQTGGFLELSTSASSWQSTAWAIPSLYIGDNQSNVTITNKYSQLLIEDQVNLPQGQTFIPYVTTKYFVYGTNANGCTNSDDVTITVNPLPTVEAGDDQTVCLGTEVTLAGSGAVSYVWNNNVINSQAFTPEATATYTVVGTDANGCENSDDVTVTVNPLPTVEAGDDQTVCLGTEVTLAGSGAVSYIWNNVINNQAFTPEATATYTVVGTDGNGCENSDNVTVTVNPLPTVEAGDDQTVCLGTEVTLAGSGAVSYVWNNNVINNQAFTPEATATYTVVGTDANGCENSDDVTVTVNPLPTVEAGDDQTVCLGTEVTLAGSGAVSYIWNSNVINNQAFTPEATATYTVVGTDGNGCENSDDVTATVNPLPTVEAGDDQTVCLGTEVTLAGSGAVSYIWNNNVINNQAFTPEATATYTVVGTDGNGCENSDDVTVTVNPLPTVEAGDDQTVCLGTEVTLTGSGAVSYVWNNNVINNQAFMPEATATYTVVGTDANGCENSDDVTVTVNPLPTVEAGDDQTVCLGTEVTLAGSGAVSYVWNNNVINNQAFTPEATATYTVVGTDANGCENSDDVTVTVNPLPIVDLGGTQAICGSSKVLDAGNVNSTYLWSNGSTSQTISVNHEGNYSVIVTNEFGCENSGEASHYKGVSSYTSINGGQHHLYGNGTYQLAGGNLSGSIAVMEQYPGYGGPTLILDNVNHTGGFEIHANSTLIICGNVSNTSSGQWGQIKIHPGATVKVFGNWTVNSFASLKGNIIMMEGSSLHVTGSVQNQSGLNINYVGAASNNAFVDNAINYTNANFISTGQVSGEQVQCPTYACSAPAQPSFRKQESTIEKETQFIAYPNPATDILNIKFNSELNSTVQITVINNLGQVVKTETANKADNQLIININISDLPAGIYTVIGTSAQEKYSQRVLVK